MSCCCVAFWSPEASVGEEAGIPARLRAAFSSAEHRWRKTTLETGSCLPLQGYFALNTDICFLSSRVVFHLMFIHSFNVIHDIVYIAL